MLNVDQIDAYKVRIEELEEELRQVKELLLPPFVPPHEWRLTSGEIGVLRLLVSRAYLTTEMAKILLDMSREHLGTVLTKMRIKLKPLDVEIQNDRDRGWYLDRETKEKILRLCKEWLDSHTIANLFDMVEATKLLYQLARSEKANELNHLNDVLRYIRRTL